MAKQLRLLALSLMVFIGSLSYPASGESDEAYVTLLYGDEFVLGVRVLGKSIRDTGTTKDLVVLVSDGVSSYAQDLLQADGWIVQKISLLSNPNPTSARPKRFWGVYTKLKIFNLTKYKKVVYLDADTIVVKSVEDLFKCGKFCANLKHSERLNSGVMVVEPSETLFKDMMSQVNTLPSYTGGDQGFLNSYYSDFPNAHLFDPDISEADLKSRPEPDMQRLSTLYNADVGLYMLANKWMVDEKELRIIHYTLGPLKPWDWYTAWLVKPVQVWQEIRDRVEESLPGTGGGRNPNDQLIVTILFLLPIFIVILYYYRSSPCFQVNRDLFGSACVLARRIYNRYRSGGFLPVTNSIQQYSNGMNSKVPPYLGVISILACFVLAGISLGIAFILIPRQVTPWTGLLLLYELTFTSFFLLFQTYLHFVYHFGSSGANQSVNGYPRNVSNFGSSVSYYWIGMGILALFAPLLPFLLGISALFAKLGLMVGGGIILAIFMTHASEQLALRAFVKGERDRDLAE